MTQQPGMFGDILGKIMKPFQQYVMPGIEIGAGAIGEYFAPGNPLSSYAIGNGIGQYAGEASNNFGQGSPSGGSAMGGGSSPSGLSPFSQMAKQALAIHRMRQVGAV